MTEQAGGQRTEGGTESGESTETSTANAGGQETSASTGSTGAAEQSSGQSSEQSSEQSSGSDSGTSSPTASSESSSGSSSEAATSTTATATKTRPSDDPPPDEAPTTQQRTPDVSAGSAPHGREERAPLNVGELVWKVATVLASVIRIVAYVIAVVLVAYVLLTLVGVNPLNAIAQVVGGVANSTVLAFRDLFLIADPVFAIVVNYGLAAVFWVLVAEFGSRLVRWLGARFS
ncbi:hypothetical protein [Actinomycetospora succinea]|uniref:hypothetical protein n=1 Tax=Actinomycetospora succinea TaxID=663603 RepID=UPI001414FAE7|nr:hypothetical protein [Actinomycetospora succinea]